MNIKTLVTTLCVASVFIVSLTGGTPAQEKEFLDKYKTAFEKGDKATLESFLYTKGANPMALEFYKMMQSAEAGKGKITKIELIDLTPEDVKKTSEVMEGPGGTKAKLPLKPIKKLKITVEMKDENGSTTSNNESYIAESGGKYVIPVPVDAK